MNVNVACVIGMPPFKWDVAPERYGFCGNCEHEFDDGENVFCNSFSKDGVEMHRFYCNRDCARYSERERLKPDLEKYMVVLKDWTELIEEVLQIRAANRDFTHGTFPNGAACTAFVKLQRRIVLLLQKTVDSILKRQTALYKLYKAKLQEEWGEMLALCVNDAMALSTAAEMKHFDSLCVISRNFVDE